MISHSTMGLHELQQQLLVYLVGPDVPATFGDEPETRLSLMALGSGTGVDEAVAMATLLLRRIECDATTD